MIKSFMTAVVKVTANSLRHNLLCNNCASTKNTIIGLPEHHYFTYIHWPFSLKIETCLVEWLPVLMQAGSAKELRE